MLFLLGFGIKKTLITNIIVLSIHGENTEEDPEYFRASFGWHYSETIQTLYVKLNHENEEEEIVVTY